MQQAHEIPEVETLRFLNGIPTAPFHEARLLRALERDIQEDYSGDPRVRLHRDGYGNLSLRFAGSNATDAAPVIAFAAHADHPALHVAETKDGRLIATVRGGLNETLLPGAAVTLHADGDNGLRVPARVGGRSNSDDASSPFVLEPDDPLSADEAQHVAFATLALGPTEIEEDVLRAPVLDDFAGIAMMLQALRRIAHANLPIAVHLVFHRAEEVGFIGACGAALGRLVPEGAFVYSVEMSSYVARDQAGAAVSVATPADGPIIRTGDRITPAYDVEALGALRAAALDNPTVPVQQRLMWGGACEASLYYAFGYRTAGICLALLAAHNNGELEGHEHLMREGVYVSDLVAGTGLLVALARTVADRPRLYRRLGDHSTVPGHDELRKRVVASLERHRRQGLI